MAQERRRAALAALCVLGVALAATLFPASGFGSQPAGVGLGDSDASPGSASGPDPSPTSTVDADPPTTTASGSGDESTETTTTETTTTETTTTAVGDAGTPGTGADGLFGAVGLAVLGLVVLGSVVGFLTGALRVAGAAGPLPFTLVVAGTPVGELVGSVPARTMALVVGFASSVPRLLDDAAGLTRAVGGSLGSVLGGLGRASADALRIGASGLAAAFTAIPRALAGLGTGAGLFASLGSVSAPSLGGRSRSDDSGGPTASRSDDDDAEDAPPSVEEAWRTMRDRVSSTDARTRTPGEVARAAVRRGYPDDAVRRLTEAFREVRYGGLPREDRTESARSALDRLRDHWRDER